MKRCFLLVGLSLCLRSDIPTSWTPEFSLQVRTIGAVVPSPDGQLAAYTQTRAIAEGERSEQITQIWIGSAGGSRRFQLTRGEKSATAPAWSPDGRLVYFSSDRSGKANVYRVPVAGGEAEILTDLKGPLGQFKVSPDGKTVAYTAHETPADLEKAKKEKRDFRVVGADPELFSLYTIPAEPDADGKREAKKVFDAKYHIQEFDWSPDGKTIAFEHRPGPLADEWTRADIAEVELATGKVTELAHTPAAESDPHYSPDGRYIAFTQSADPPPWAEETRIVLLARSSGEVRLLPATLDEKPQLLGWSPDSKEIYYLENRGARTAIFEMPVDGPPKAVYLPDRGVIGMAARLNSTGSLAGFSYESASEAPEAYIMPMRDSRPVRVSGANDGLPKIEIGETKTIHWKSNDGLEIEGLLTYPVGYQSGKKYPLILNIHGGPTGVFTETFTGRFSIYPIASFAARGWAVLRPNPRGSSGYGKPFRFANLNDWGGKDFEDEMTGVDAVIAMGVADPDHMAVMGWSYGGFMTSWVVGHTNRFRAAVVGAGVTDLWSFTGTSDIPGFLPFYFGGEPWLQFEAFARHSPVSFAASVTTPTLVLHGEADERVPTSQGYEFYHALKKAGVTTKMVVYPRTPHGPREPKFILDIAQRNLDWVEKYAR